MDPFSNSKINLKLPLKTRGRPRSLKQFSKRSRQKRASYSTSNLAQLHQEGKITTEQFNAGETFIWLLQTVRRNIPLPRRARSSYAERIEGVQWEIGEENEEKVKEAFNWWHQSLAVLKAAGETTKTLIENFLYNNSEEILSSLSQVEIQLIQRGLEYLARIYKI